MLPFLGTMVGAVLSFVAAYLAYKQGRKNTDVAAKTVAVTEKTGLLELTQTAQQTLIGELQEERVQMRQEIARLLESNGALTESNRAAEDKVWHQTLEIRKMHGEMEALRTQVRDHEQTILEMQGRRLTGQDDDRRKPQPPAGTEPTT